MSSLILKMSVSLDGFVAGPNGELDWLFRSMSEDGAAWTVDKISQAGAHLMGRKTFHDMVAYWPSSNEVFAAPMNKIPKIVFSRKGFDPSASEGSTRGFQDAVGQKNRPAGKTADDAKADLRSWLGARVITGDLKEQVAHLKKQPGKDLIAHGGASFAQALVQTGLIDEFWFLTYPVALGRGLPLFSLLPRPLDLKLVDSIPFKGGAVAHVYRVLG